MQKYVKNVNEETGLCELVAMGDTSKCEEEGFELRDVELAWNGSYYLTGKCPEKPAVEKAELTQYTYEQKCAVAYGGVTIVKDGAEYLFETSMDSITMCNSQANAFIADETLTSVDWKVYQNNVPVLLTLTKAQFVQIFSFGMQMINSAFAVEGDLNGEVAEMTEAQRKDETYIANFKARVQSSFGQIPRRFVITAAEQETDV